MINNGLADATTIYHQTMLYEPDKDVVWAWKKGDPLPNRQVFVTAKTAGTVREVIVDVTASTIISNQVVLGYQPLIVGFEFGIACGIALDDPRTEQAILARGYFVNQTTCIPNTEGFFGDPNTVGKRIIGVNFYVNRAYYWAYPLEGLIVRVDLVNDVVFEFVDEMNIGPTPPYSPHAEYEEHLMNVPLRNDIKPTSIEQPQGVRFTIDGHMVNWGKWSFHIKPDFRVGAILSTVKFNDTLTERVRKVLYQAHVSELTVPYQDKHRNWYWKTYFDAGEYSIGGAVQPLIPENDCPKNAYYMSGVYPVGDGTTYSVPNVLCIFEKDAAEPIWRITDPYSVPITRESRKRISLVVRFIADNGNYAYMLDSEFNDDGSLSMGVTSHGLTEIKGVYSAHMSDPTAAQDTEHGALVNPYMLSVNHDHFFSYRIDLDVDGKDNTFVKSKLQTQRLQNHPRKSVWIVNDTVIQTENEAKSNISMATPAMWRFTNNDVKNRMGYDVSYELKPGNNVMSLMTEDDWPQLRAGFIKNHLWVTPYRKNETYAGGMYPNQSNGNNTIAVWTEQNRSILDTDIVVWYTLGFHHAPRTEDFPSMPGAGHHHFTLRPFHFFDKNPAMDVPAQESIPDCKKYV